MTFKTTVTPPATSKDGGEQIKEVGWLGIYFNIHEADARSYGSVPHSIGPQIVAHNIPLHLWFRKDQTSLQAMLKDARATRTWEKGPTVYAWLEVAGVWIITIPIGDRLFIGPNSWSKIPHTFPGFVL
jgi:hypothetical protein